MADSKVASARIGNRFNSTHSSMRLLHLVVALSVFGAASSHLHSQPYAINWHTIDGGGGTSTGGVYSMSGTIGQPDAAVWQSDGYALAGGFWGGTATAERAIYLPVVLRGYP